MDGFHWPGYSAARRTEECSSGDGERDEEYRGRAQPRHFEAPIAGYKRSARPPCTAEYCARQKKLHGNEDGRSQKHLDSWLFLAEDV